MIPEGLLLSEQPPGQDSEPGEASFGAVVLDAVIGPLAAFCTFIGSMGNAPLAGLPDHNGVSFAGVTAFLFSDLVVLPVLQIQVRHYGWRLALYIAGVFLGALWVVGGAARAVL